ncbi:Uncharacterized protein FWK35_00030977, partial [Aphis craccivora]
FVGSKQKVMIINLYKTKNEEQPDINDDPSLPTIPRTSSQRILKELGFEYTNRSCQPRSTVMKNHHTPIQCPKETPLRTRSTMIQQSRKPQP